MNILVCGRLKQGKTTKAIELAHKFSPGVVIWDPRHMQRGIIIQTDKEGSLADNLEQAISEQKFLNGPLVIWPGPQLEEDFAAICSVLFYPPERFAGDGEGNGGFAFVVDEAADLQRSQSIHDSLRIAVKQHPRAVVVIQCTHSLQEWHRSSKDTMSHLYCFRLQGRSLTHVVEYCDAEDEEALSAAIKALPEHAYVHVDFESAPGQPQWAVCEPLDSQTVAAIQCGQIPNSSHEEHHHAEGRQTERMEPQRTTGGRRGRAGMSTLVTDESPYRFSETRARQETTARGGS